MNPKVLCSIYLIREHVLIPMTGEAEASATNPSIQWANFGKQNVLWELTSACMGKKVEEMIYAQGKKEL